MSLRVWKAVSNWRASSIPADDTRFRPRYMRDQASQRAMATLPSVYCMNHPWLTTTDWPVSAFDGNAARNTADFRHVLHGRELAVDGLLQHHRLDDLRLRDAELARLLRDLLLDQRRADEAGADHVRTDPMRGPLLRHDLGQADQTVLGSDVRSLEG